VQPVRGRLEEEFSRPPVGLCTMAIMLLTIPAISGRLHGWQANRFADGDVDSLGD